AGDKLSARHFLPSFCCRAKRGLLRVNHPPYEVLLRANLIAANHTREGHLQMSVAPGPLRLTPAYAMVVAANHTREGHLQMPVAPGPLRLTRPTLCSS
ncbi:hypothetical protein LJC19_07865, partial [Oxalobacter sp. OttesenSCG-928-P03]|nr:hypothetical protein [Oxalobacter sp. OttesenSCG-928-P03]